MVRIFIIIFLFEGVSMKKFDYKSDRCRMWSCVSYLPNLVLLERLRSFPSLKHFAFVCHLPDSSNKQSHIHVCLSFNNAVRFSTVHDLLCDPFFNAGNCMADKLYHPYNMVYEYFTHEFDDDKIKYSLDDICSDNLSYWDMGSSSADDCVAILDRLLAGDDLYSLVRDYGTSFIYHYRQYRDLVDDIRYKEKNI